MALLAPAHDHRHDGQHRRALPDRGRHAARAVVGGGLWDLWWTLVAGLAVNVYIVGVNQLEDVEIDRVNKPFLPLASGEMTHEYARAVVAATAGIAVVLAVTQGAEETVAVLAGLVVGTAYSTPPLRLKRFPRRRVAVHLRRALGGGQPRRLRALLARARPDGTVSIPAAVWALTIVVLPFSFAIAILKDVPDAEGDRRFRIRTFTVRVGGAKVLRARAGGARARLRRDGGRRARC